ncbi:MAG TPA: MaoC family dehydratase [Myxococcota bacterium]|nr:MaoC family dehydratase [Myxococcota bacterium]HQK50295.1 MaoC family dehydratase [Myxococcota bacterium]
MTVFFEDLEIGRWAEFAKTFSEADITMFAGVSGDHNPVHVNEEYARTTRFGGRIVHGALTASLISAVLGMQIPGTGTIYLSQTLRFLAPVRLGDTVTARATVKALDPARKRVTFETVCRVGDRVVLEGEAVVLAPSRA